MNVEEIKNIVLSKRFAELSPKEREAIRSEISNEEEYQLYRQMLTLLAIEEDEELTPSPAIKSQLLEEFKQKRWTNNLENTHNTPKKIVPLVQPKKKKKWAIIGWVAAVVVGIMAVSIYTKSSQYNPKTLAFAEVEENIEQPLKPEQIKEVKEEKTNTHPVVEQELSAPQTQEETVINKVAEQTSLSTTKQKKSMETQAEETEWSEEPLPPKTPSIQPAAPQRAMLVASNNQLVSVSMATHKELIQLLYTAL